MKSYLIVTIFHLVMILSNAAANDFYGIERSNMPDLPGQEIGLSGCFVGVHNGVMIVAGGTNFPGKMPWEGGRKEWHDDIYVLQKKTDGTCQWLGQTYKLPQKAAYGVSVSTSKGVLCIGGCDQDQCFKEAYLLEWNTEAKTIEIIQYPPLPEPLAYSAGAVIDDHVYVVGGQRTTVDPTPVKCFYRLDFSKENAQWDALALWPGVSRRLAMCASQNNGYRDCIYLFGGQHYGFQEGVSFLDDCYCYDPGTDEWNCIAELPWPVSAASCLPYGTNSILLFGGDDGKETLKRIEIDKKIRDLRNNGEKSQIKTLEEKFRVLSENHLGFSGNILAYNTVIDEWILISDPAPLAVTTTAIAFDDKIVIPAGEIRPGQRTTKIEAFKIKSNKKFRVLNYGILTIYLLSLVLMGAYFSKRENTTEDFFLGGRRIPWWAAGLSIFGTQLSAITFMAIPAKTFVSDWLYLPTILGMLVLTPVITKAFLPFYRRLNVTSAYEYLELRFSYPIRLMGSVMFIIMQLGRLGIILLLPSLALYVVTGMNVFVCIILMGVLATIYTVMGGIEAVIWTDVIQVVVLVVGAFICFIVIAFNIEGGVPQIVKTGFDAGKFDIIDWHFDLTKVTFIVLALSTIGGIAGPYANDQGVIQRYLTTRDEKSAAKGIWTNALLTIPASILFYSLGSALYAFYKYNPSRVAVDTAGTDVILPWFIVNELPTGVSGLVIAGIFAASMSSLDSSMNSVATVVVTDFYRRLFRGVTESKCLRLAKTVTAIVGFSGTIFALLMATTNIQSLWDQCTVIISLFGAGLGGLFVLGIFTKTANVKGALSGFVVSGATQYYISSQTDIHFFIYTFSGMISCVLTGFIVSALSGGPNKDLQGLTVYSQGIQVSEY